MPQRDPTLEAALRDWFGAKFRGDGEAIAALLSDDAEALAVGTSSDEWASGPDFVGLHRDAGAFDADIVDLTAYSEGRFAWAALRGAVHAADGARIPVRVTLVLLDGQVVQTHASIPSDAEW